MHTWCCVCIYVFFFCLFFWVYLSAGCLTLCLLDTGIFICTTTSCRPCHRTFLPGFHRFGECACFSWLSTEILLLSESLMKVLIFYHYVTCAVFWVLCVCVCVFLCHGVHRQTNRDSKQISESTCVCVYLFICSFFLVRLTVGACLCMCFFVSRCAPADKQTQQRD